MGNTGNTKLELFWENDGVTFWEHDIILFEYNYGCYAGEVKNYFGVQVIELENASIPEWGLQVVSPDFPDNLIFFDDFLNAYLGKELTIIEIKRKSHL